MADILHVEELLKQNLPKETQQEIENLREALRRSQDEREYRIPIETSETSLRFAVISDIHAGSLYARYDALQEFFDYIEAEDINIVFVVGDILDGHGMYKGQEFELHSHGVKKQLDELVEKFPNTYGMRVYFITGNHDYSFDKQVALGIGEQIADKTGWRYIGRDYGEVDLFNQEGVSLRVGLMHPSGGTAYAISYRSQKIVEQIPGGRKPDLLCIGHYHKAEILPKYRNVYTIQAGCFQSQTPYMRAKPTDAHVGGWVVEAVLGERKYLTSRVRAEFISFYEPEE